MKKSKSTIRSFAKAKWFTISIVGILVVAFVTATALMQGNEKKTSKASPDVVERANAKLEERLFVDEDRATESEPEDNATQAAPDQAEITAYELPKILPAVFNGDVRRLPVVPQPEREE